MAKVVVARAVRSGDGMEVKRVGFGLAAGKEKKQEEICWVSTRKRLAFILLSFQDLDPLRRAPIFIPSGRLPKPQHNLLPACSIVDVQR
jgi:hypothetical protein